MIAPPTSSWSRASSREPHVVRRAARPRARPRHSRSRWAGVGAGEADQRLEPPRERVVDVAAQVGGEDDDAGEVLDPLQQVGDLLVGVAVVRRGGGGARAEQRVGLVEEQDPVLVRGLVEDAGEVLLGLADVLRDHHRQVDAVDVEPGLAADQRRGQRLAGAGRTVEERAVAGRERAPQAPVVEDARLVARARR